MVWLFAASTLQLLLYYQMFQPSALTPENVVFKKDETICTFEPFYTFSHTIFT